MTDLFLSHEGDLVLDMNGDLQTATDLAEQLQAIALRIKTPQGSFSTVPSLGNVLDSLVGEFMTEALLQQGEQLLYDALSDSLLLSTVYFVVHGAPITPSQALFVIYLQSAQGRGLFSIPFDFQHGILASRIAGTITDPVSGATVTIPAIGVDPLIETEQ